MHTIMVVDDNPSIVDIFVTMLKQGGYAAVSAHSGEEAISLLEKTIPDLIFLDILMEPLNGWETLERIKRNDNTKNIPVMMLTAKNLGPEEARKYSADIEDYIVKPITRRQLYDTIEQFFLRRESIEDQARRAADVGIDPAVVVEYKTLCREIDIRKRLQKLLKVFGGAGDHSKAVREDVISAMNVMGEEIRKREERLSVMREEYGLRGEEPPRL